MINFRKASISDAYDLDYLLTLLINDEKQYDKFINQDYKVKDFYINKIPHQNNFIFVAEKNNEIVGYIYGYVLESDNVYVCDGAKLDALFVKVDYRKLGIADRLIQEFINWVKDNDLKYVEVNVMLNNTKALNLYKKYNFKELKANLTLEI